MNRLLVQLRPIQAAMRLNAQVQKARAEASSLVEQNRLHHASAVRTHFDAMQIPSTTVLLQIQVLGVAKASTFVTRKSLNAILYTLKNEWVFENFPIFALKALAINHRRRGRTIRKRLISIAFKP